MQPSFIDLFGTGSSFNATTNKFEIPESVFISNGVDTPATASPIAIYAAIVKNAHSWLVTNTDQAVNATSTLNSSAPFSRNSQQKTSYTYLVQLFGSYTSPTLDPDQL